MPVLAFLEAHLNGAASDGGGVDLDGALGAGSGDGVSDLSKGGSGVADRTGAGGGHFDASAAWHAIQRLTAQTLQAMTTTLADVDAPQVDGLRGAELWSPPREGSPLWANVTTRFDDESWGAWRSQCFHLLGIDVMLTRSGRAHLLEVNCNPSLGIDAVYPTEGPAAHAVPAPPPAMEPLVEQALPLMKGRGVKVCKCRSHHRPHLHAPCAIDLSVKHAAVGGALTIVARDIAAARAGGPLPSTQELVQGTRYDSLDAFVAAPSAGGSE